MAKKDPQILITFSDGALPQVTINQYAKITPLKIERALRYVLKEWKILRALDVHKRKVTESEDAKIQAELDAENSEQARLEESENV